MEMRVTVSYRCVSLYHGNDVCHCVKEVLSHVLLLSDFKYRVNSVPSTSSVAMCQAKSLWDQFTVSVFCSPNVMERGEFRVQGALLVQWPVFVHEEWTQGTGNVGKEVRNSSSQISWEVPATEWV